MNNELELPENYKQAFNLGYELGNVNPELAKEVTNNFEKTEDLSIANGLRHGQEQADREIKRDKEDKLIELNNLRNSQDIHRDHERDI